MDEQKTSEISRNDNPIKNHPKGFYTPDGKYVCPVKTTFEILKGRWKINILWALYNNPVIRFNELRDLLDGISDKVLAAQLRELEDTHFIQRPSFTGFPPKVEYSLTDFALTFSPILAQIADWGVANKERILEIVETDSTKRF